MAKVISAGRIESILLHTQPDCALEKLAAGKPVVDFTSTYVSPPVAIGSVMATSKGAPLRPEKAAEVVYIANICPAGLGHSVRRSKWDRRPIQQAPGPWVATGSSTGRRGSVHVETLGRGWGHSK
jgi:hypothetical protein